MSTLSFDIGGTFIKYALISEDYKIIEKFSKPTEASRGGKAIISDLIEIVNSFNKPIDRIAISTAGQVDSAIGKIVYSTGNIPDYTGLCVKEFVEVETKLPAFVENDVNCAAVGEAIFGAAKGATDFICLTYGTGIGGALWLNNGLYRGSASSAGELGHIVTHIGEKDCTCGGKGCYESYASAQALVRAVNEKSSLNLDGRGIFLKENFENPEIRGIIDSWIDEIVLGLINIIYTFNPELIVLGGGIMQEAKILQLIEAKLYPRLMKPFEKVKIVQASLGNDAALLGAAYLAKKSQSL